MIHTFRKRPIVVQAIQLTEKSIVDCIEFVFDIGMETSMIGMNATIENVKAEGGFVIPTKEGDMKAVFGDYIIKESFPTNDRQFYPCKPDIFHQTYELI